MDIIDTNFDNLKIVNFFKADDLRGAFIKPFTNELSAVMENISEVYFSSSKKNVFRGLHFQSGAAAQSKFVCCLAGQIEDVAIDLRKEKKTYGNVFRIKLNAFENKGVIIPGGFAHGIYAHEDSTIVNFCDKPYSPGNEGGICPTTVDEISDLNIEIISEKDKSLPSFKKIING
tara:strand:- start:18 stop:539 length:522 start_codon:yes stop_codon:yes gene_type:complete